MKYICLVYILFFSLGLSGQSEITKAEEQEILMEYAWLLTTSENHACKTADTKKEKEVVEAQRKEEVKDLKAYPNPSGICRFKLEFDVSSSPTEIMLSDMSGRLLYSETLEDFEGLYSKELDLSVAKSSMVVLTVIQNGQPTTRKIVVQ